MTDNENSYYYYFGFGSLVNLRTRSDENRTYPACLKGWRREWRLVATSDGYGVCSLSVREDSNSQIRGVVVRDSVDNLPALDERERHYDRLTLRASKCEVDEALSDFTQFYLYRGMKAYRRWGDRQAPILLSYIDAVLDGFHQHWPQDGIAHFIDTTDGWHVPILNDRQSPRYPRAVTLTAEVEGKIDEALADSGAMIF